ncbi:hypothetical protein KC717_00965 [Candidatus Dojkabacteria bacterium]|uniref:Uncharacterized protein n=1 Tax=Candidatus Dojkabacteria bacterium TaxID=2099670 RepID=A0A955L7Y2_9BACT|nr:hypothetical protein [Candidatus Dojkabacteria bacterium]
MDKHKKAKRPKTAKDILMSHDWLEQRHKSAKYVTTEHQDFGLRLAHRLNDPEHKSLYIKLAKEEDRGLLEQAISFADDYHKVKNKARVFMWKLKELRRERKQSREDEERKQTTMF